MPAAARCLLCLALWLFCATTSGGEATANQFVSGLEVRNFTGAWYPPDRNGEGFIIEALSNDEALVYWYTYDENGNQRWLFNNGLIDGDRIVIETLLRTEGPMFGPDFDPGTLLLDSFGALEIEFADCDSGEAVFTDLDGETLTLNLVRLSEPIGTVCTRSVAVAAGDRRFGIDLARGDLFGNEFATALSLGTQVISLPLYWDELETAPGVYAESSPIDDGNAFYPLQGISVALEINPIDTNNLRMPADLAGRSFDDPEVIQRFEALVNHVLERSADLTLSSVALGNEIDGVLGSDRAAWAAYGELLVAGKDRVHELRPGVPVGTKVTFDGLVNHARDPAYQLNRLATVVLATYYPLDASFSVRAADVVAQDFDLLTGIYRDRPIHVLEIGYPSTPLCGSSPTTQAEFVASAFRAWDRHRHDIDLMIFTWLTDIDPAAVATFVDYYGNDSLCFTEYLGTLGLRNFDGSPKPGFEQLTAELLLRGWE